MKRIAALVTFVTLFVPANLLAQGASAETHQSPVALVVKAGTGFGTFNAPIGTKDFNKSKVQSGVIPAVELLIKSSSRFSFGIEGIFGTRFKDDTHNVISVTDSFGYIGSDGKEHQYSEPGTVFASAQTLLTKKINSIVIGSLYVNGGASGSRVRPFLGGGFGIGFGEIRYTYTTYVHPVFSQLAGFKYDLTDSVERSNTSLWKAEGGVTVRLKKHLQIRASVRVMNGVVMPTVGIQF